MGLLDFLKPKGASKPEQAPAPNPKRMQVLLRGNGHRAVRGSYDAAQTIPQSSAHWVPADALSADRANSPSVRQTLRQRARYEVANNSYARGLVETYCLDVVGTGPRLQLLTKDEDLNDRVEALWRAWARRQRLARKLRALHRARVVDGEGFARISDNPGLPGPVTLDLMLLECERVAAPMVSLDSRNIDGVVLDEWGNVTQYQVNKMHPGDSAAVMGGHDSVEARYMLHWYGQDRPEQHRGVPPITAALELFAQLRRYRQATLDATETAADIAGIAYTDSPPGGEADDDVEPFDAFPVERNMLVTLPFGWRLEQFKAEQPPATFKDYCDEFLREIARCVLMPFNVAGGDSSRANFASARLDQQTYENMIRVTQYDMGLEIVDAVLEQWLAEVRLALRIDMPEEPEHIWFWDMPRYTINPSQDEAARAKRLETHTSTYAEEYGRRGLDWRQEIRQRAREHQEMLKLGLPMWSHGPGRPTGPS